MCGLAGIHRLNGREVEKMGVLADELLLAIESRGHDAAGIAAVYDDGSTFLDKHPVTARRFVQGRRLMRRDARTVLVHTRFRTTGKRPLVDCHPHRSGPVVAVHNGTIANANEIFHAFKLPRKATVDSEAIPALVNYAGWNQAPTALALLEGGAATAIASSEHPRDLLLARVRWFPMVYGVTGDVVVFASEARAILQAWQRTYKRTFPGTITHLKDGEMVTLSDGQTAQATIPGVKVVERRPTAKATVKTKSSKSTKGAARAARKRAATRKQADDPRRRTRTTYTLAEVDEILDSMGYATDYDDWSADADAEMDEILGVHRMWPSWMH